MSDAHPHNPKQDPHPPPTTETDPADWATGDEPQPGGHAMTAAPPHNPKQGPTPPSNPEKDPDDWVTGDEPMTGAQTSYLKTLSEEAGEQFDEQLTKADASKKIDALQEQTGRGT